MILSIILIILGVITGLFTIGWMKISGEASRKEEERWIK